MKNGLQIVSTACLFQVLTLFSQTGFNWKTEKMFFQLFATLNGFYSFNIKKGIINLA